MKKGQAALEFLMTYGWAFLVILIVIGALAYFGVLSPARFLPERCTFSAEFDCADYLIDYDDVSETVDVTIKMQNNVGKNIQVKKDRSTAKSVEGFGGCTVASDIFDADGLVAISYESNPTYVIKQGEYFQLKAVDCDELGGMSPGKKYKLDLIIDWFDPASGEAFGHTTQGELYATVE